MDDEVPILDEENYSTWRIEMILHLKEMGMGIWKVAIGRSVSLKNKSNFVGQREGKKNDALALKTILSGTPKPDQRDHGTMHFHQGSMAKYRRDISKQERKY
jgi:hypothetical protein